MNAASALEAAVAVGVRVSLTEDGTTLRLAAQTPPPPAVVDDLRRFKPGVMAILRAAAPVGAELSSAWPDEEGTKAKHGPLEWLDGVILNNAQPPPAGVPYPRWQRAVLDAAEVVEMHGAALHRVGWTAVDVFGVDPTAPADTAAWGVALALDGAKIVRVGRAQVIATRPDGRTAILGKLRRPGAVPVWTIAKGWRR